MHPEADEPTDDVAGSGLQREPTRRNIAVPASWLADFAGTREDHDLDETVRALRRRERLAEDADLVAWLRRYNFTGRDYDLFATELARYGYAVMVAWIRQGAIFGKCRERGAGLPEPPLGALSRPDVAEELANETVAKALRSFRDTVLIPGRWNADRGASLKTFFIGQCLIRFPNIYRAWLNNEVHHDVLVDELTLFDRPASGGPPADPAQLAVLRQEVDVLLTGAPPRTRTMLTLILAGYTQADVASLLGLTENAVQKALSYYRTRLTGPQPAHIRRGA
ncbi:RNA polymerase sigma factor [Micromonospora narathiwatensis]|uniref:DNA-directed RNA polymerase specialized sigma subunit, sigma24 family n=1 Tax=Micromonospora narathiwatensis TaxID=299146 RepID=A0A1A8Z909_9ACTN|nr:sigma factor-like helix-turn-helix DNA-binding protein [Micromonospora narathiwatensis]SBT40347.1 DNA-directed RNA polymerase specialized sigma subunit, sigma24 family [Micromonospora narathiwatensis]